MLTRVEAKVANVHHIIPGRIISLSSVVITPYHLILFEMVMSLSLCAWCESGRSCSGGAVSSNTSISITKPLALYMEECRKYEGLDLVFSEPSKNPKISFQSNLSPASFLILANRR